MNIFKAKIFRKRSGQVGIICLSFLITISIYSLIFIPLDSFQQWNNPNYWIDYPKSAAPVWTNIGFEPKQFEHKVLTFDESAKETKYADGLAYINNSFTFEVSSDTFPSDFMVFYNITYLETPPIVDVSVNRPDNNTIPLYFAAIQGGTGYNNTVTGRIFSADQDVKANLEGFQIQTNLSGNLNPSDILFSSVDKISVLEGKYEFKVNFIFFNNNYKINDIKIVVSGNVFGLFGTDDLRRDLSIGIIWGTPVALFIGLVVSIFSITIGLIYGVIAGYKGNRTDEFMMRLNDLFYSVPSLPILVILSITVGRSIFLLAAFLIVFGWVGMAKLARSQTLQIKNMQYVEASRLMGQKDWKIIMKHIIPQLLPFTFANIAIAVPSAILGEAAISFLGLGDPSIPTWGQILNEANSASAANRGLWWWIIPPGLFIFLTGISFALIGRTLESTSRVTK